MYTETDYFYDSTLCAVICTACIKQYKIDNKDYTEVEVIDAVKYWEGEDLYCETCNSVIKSEYGSIE